jgi:O-antigen/teichoic acid export membrane protein
MSRLIKLYAHFSQDSLYRNSTYLMSGAIVTAFFGFFFWIICARLFNSEQVGIATTLISVMSLISSFSFLGLGNSLIKYLPTSERKNEMINTSFTIVALTSISISIVYLIFINSLSPKLLFIKNDTIFSLLFIVFIVASSLNTISENIFIAFRSSVYILIKNIIFSIVRLMLPFILITLGAYGIFMSMGLATTIAYIFSLIILLRKFTYLLKPKINQNIIRKMAKFSLGNFIGGFIGSLPSMVLPIFLTNTIGAKYSAYFYMDMMVASLLYIVPTAVSQSLFAEGAYNEAELKIHLKKSIKIIAMIIIPAIIITFFFGKYILLAFGDEYSSGGVILLRILIISGIFFSINSVGNTILYIKHKIKLYILINFIGAFVILSLSTLLIHQNLIGIGIAWIIGNIVVSGIYFIINKDSLSYV